MASMSRYPTVRFSESAQTSKPNGLDKAESSAPTSPPAGARTHADDPAALTAALVSPLVCDGQLAAALRLPGTAGPLRITAQLRTA